MNHFNCAVPDPLKIDVAAIAAIEPVISIGMPIFNAGIHLRKAVASILAQTFQRWELLIIDDASTDGAVDSIRDLDDPRIKITVGTQNRGLAARLNEAVALARGQYFARMDQDDMSHPDRLALQYAFLKSMPHIDIVGARCLLIDGEDFVRGTLEFPEHHSEICSRPWRGIPVPHPTWLAKIEWFRRNPYHSPGPYFCEDQELLLRTHRSARFAVLPEALLAYRVKGPVPPLKFFRTRATLLMLQTRHFISHGQAQEAMKALGWGMSKCVHDLLAPLFGREARSAVAGVPLMDLSENERARWVQTLPKLSSEKLSNSVSIKPQSQVRPGQGSSEQSAKDGNMHDGNYLKPRSFWLLAFIFSCLQALMVQKLVLPLMPSLHAGHGLMINDAIIFHEAASEAANRIRSAGWSEWSLYPTGFSGNVGLLSALYAVFGPHPAVFIPLNAAAHVTGAVMLYLIGPLLWPGRIGRAGGLLAGFLFVIFPSTLLWYSQNHKDAFAIAGTLMMLCAWLRIFAVSVQDRVDWLSLLLSVVGSIFMLVVRPYLTLLTLGGLAFSWLAILAYAKIVGTFPVRSLYSPRVMWLLAIAVVAAKVGAMAPSFPGDFSRGDFSRGDFSRGDFSRGDFWSWRGDFWSWTADDVIPAWVEAPFRKISEIRVHFINYGQSIGAGSGVDQHIAPDNIWEAIMYMPRAFLVGSLSPYPTSWIERVSAPRLTAASETLLWYFFAAGLVFLARRRVSAALVGGIVFGAFITTIFSYTNPNVGTLYRVRFGCWMFFLLAGAVGWAGLLLPFLDRFSDGSSQDPLSSVSRRKTDQSTPSAGLSGLAASGSVAMGIAFVGFLGFLARDLLLINLRGMDRTLDIFFAASILPMAIVTCLVMPMADAMTKAFLCSHHAQNRSQASEIVARFLGFGLVATIAAMTLTFFFAPEAIRVLTGVSSDEVVSEGTRYLCFFTPIIFLSVWTVLGNSVLNCLNKSVQAASAQLIVPVCAIAAIVCTNPDNVLLGCVYGMLLGTALNAAIVVLLCWRQGVRLLPAWIRGAFPLESVRSYFWLATTAIFTALLVPLNYWFASKLGEGSVSGWAFTSKIIILFNGLFATGVTAVVLPYLALKFDVQPNQTGRNHFYFLLFVGILVGGFVALSLAIFAEPLVYALLSTGNKITEDQIVMLSRVLRFGALQVPVVITGSIILKSAAVSGAARAAVLASCCGLLVNILLNWMLVPAYGLEGIAVGALGGHMISTMMLCAVLSLRQGMSLLLSPALLVSWLGLAGAAFSFQTYGWIGALAAYGALFLILSVQWIFFSRQLSIYRSPSRHDVLSQ